MEEEKAPRLTEDDLRELKDLIARIDAHDGSWHEDRRKNEGDVVIYSPWSDPLTHEAMKFLYDHKLIIPFDWSKWQEGRDFFKESSPAKYERLDRQFVLKLLTAVARNDRFSDGAWVGLFESGDAQMLLHRLVDIGNSEPSTKKSLDLTKHMDFPDMSHVQPPTRPAVESMIANLNASAREPTDESFIVLLKKAYQGEVFSRKAHAKIEVIKPFSTYKPAVSESFRNYFHHKLIEGEPPALHVYAKDGCLIMSDDYSAYEMYKVTNQKSVNCVVIGEQPDIAGVTYEGRPFVLPVPSVEIIE